MRSLLSRWGAGFVLALLPYSIGAAAAPTATSAAVTSAAVIKTYGDMAQFEYSNARDAAKMLQRTIEALLAKPSQQALAAARGAWRTAHGAYTLTEGFRFGNPIVDEWEPRVNAWPLDEGLIDYVAPAYGTTSDENPLYTLNVIAHPKIRLGAKQIDASRIDKRLLRQLQEAEGVTANVATGYHAIEFLLWGQDLHGTGPGAGERPYTDYETKHCTHGNCDRRAAYLRAAADLLVDDLSEMARDWQPSGKARAPLATRGLAAILTGLGSLSYGELAGERMKLGLILHDPEEEQDCFSDDTHNSHLSNEVGMIAIWRGMQGLPPPAGGPLAAGPFLRDYAMAKAPEAARRLDAAMNAAFVRLRAIKQTADSGRMAYDQMIGPNNPAGNKMVQDAIDALVAQTRAIEGVVAALHLNVRLQDSAKFTNAGQR